MVTTYNTEIEIQLCGEDHPVITYGINDTKLDTITLNGVHTLKFNFDLSSGLNTIFIDFANKTNDTPEMVVIIDSVSVEGLCLDRFKWAGSYTPVYPEPWASQQTEPLLATMSSATYMGWNGKWVLPFTVPIFTWIHQIENLGWIYD